jgi:hypothetical protein
VSCRHRLIYYVTRIRIISIYFREVVSERLQPAANRAVVGVAADEGAEAVRVDLDDELGDGQL